MRLPAELVTVTPFSKRVALAMFILLPVLAFYLGMQFQQAQVAQEQRFLEVAVNPEMIPLPPPQLPPAFGEVGQDGTIASIQIINFRPNTVVCQQPDWYTKPDNSGCNSRTALFEPYFIIDTNSFQNGMVLKLSDIDAGDQSFDQIVLLKGGDGNVYKEQMRQECGILKYEPATKNYFLNGYRLLTQTGWDKLPKFIDAETCVEGVVHEGNEGDDASRTATIRVYFVRVFSSVPTPPMESYAPKKGY